MCTINGQYFVFKVVPLCSSHLVRQNMFFDASACLGPCAGCGNLIMSDRQYLLKDDALVSLCEPCFRLTQLQNELRLARLENYRLLRIFESMRDDIRDELEDREDPHPDAADPNSRPGNSSPSEPRSRSPVRPPGPPPSTPPPASLAKAIPASVPPPQFRNNASHPVPPSDSDHVMPSPVSSAGEPTPLVSPLALPVASPQAVGAGSGAAAFIQGLATIVLGHHWRIGPDDPACQHNSAATGEI